jgi:voltage-gated sodium channel
MTESIAKTFKPVVESRAFNFFIVGCICITSVSIGLETYPAISERWGRLLSFIDRIILGIFVVEQVVRLLAEGKRPWRYFLDPWNLFDFLIITICLLPLHRSSIAIVRLVRILRVLRLFKTFPRLRIIVNGMIKSLGSVGYIAILLGAHFYIFAVLGVSFFHDADPRHFANLQSTILTLFTVLTLETWPDIMGPSQSVFPSGAPVYFVSFIVIGTMVILNLLVGVIVGSMAEATRESDKEFQERDNKNIHGPILEICRRKAIESHIENLERELRLLKQRVGNKPEISESPSPEQEHQDAKQQQS